MIQKVDVVIPTYNSAKYLKEAVSSVLEQEGKYLNTIYIVDDGSTDNTKELVLQLKKNNRNIKYIKQANQGLSSARNTGIKHCTSDYIGFLDSDDIWYKTKLKEQINQYKKSKYTNLGLIYCEYDDIDENGKIIENYGSFRLHKEVRGNVNKYLIDCNYATGSGSGVLVKKECFEKVGLFDEFLHACEDWDMWLRISQKYSFDYVNKPLIGLRRHKTSMQAHHRHMTINLALFISKILSLRMPVREKLIKDVKREVLNYYIIHFWDIDFIRKLSSSHYNSNNNFIVWHKPVDFIKDILWVVYIRIRHFANFMARPIVMHVIPPIKTYIIKPIKKIIYRNK